MKARKRLPKTLPGTHIGGVVLGFLTTTVVAVVLGLLIGAAGMTGQFSLTLPSFWAIVIGGFVSGWTARRTGAIHGAIVAGAYLLLSGAFNLAAELDLLQAGGALLLPPMNMGGLLVADAVLLGGGALAGALGDGMASRRSRRGGGSGAGPA